MRQSYIGLMLGTALLSGCMGGPKQSMGTLLGGAGGAVLGAQVGKGKGKLAAVAVGTLLGAWAGGAIGAQLDENDKRLMENANAKAFESQPDGRSVPWQNPNTGVHGDVQPVRTYQQPSGQYCREFQQTVTVGGKTERAYGTACRQPDGSWKISQ